MSNWTKVEDDLPEPEKECYLTYEIPDGTRLVMQGYMDKYGKWVYLIKDYMKCNVTPRKTIAWMYHVKPEPYKEDIYEIKRVVQQRGVRFDMI